MSIYTQRELNDFVVTGFAEDNIIAWHQYGIPVDELIRLGRAYNGPVPHEVAERLLLWEPVIIEPVAIMGADGLSYTLPDRLSQFVANPLTQRIVNVAGAGYNPNLHLQMEEALQAATDANVDIASVVCLGDGAHMGMSFRAREGVVLGGDFGGLTPYVGFNSSLTGAIATQLDTGTIERVCDNTMRAAAHAAVNTLKIKRTRFSDKRITAASVREALDIAFAETEALCEELTRLAQIEVNSDQFVHVIDTWCPIPAEPGRAKTMRENKQAEFAGIYFDTDRQPFGETVAGLVQAHNTWQHWSQGAEDMNRLVRKAQRTMTGQVDAADAEFMAIVSNEFPEMALVLAA